ncbi:MAG: foldase protein PrsA, partial [Spirochaetota bacterium]
MKKSAVYIFLAVSLCAGCAGKNDVILTWDGGRITRGEFYDWAVSRKIDPETMKDMKRKQELRLQMMITEKIAAAEAVKAGFDKEPSVVQRVELTESNMLSRMYLDEKIVPSSGVEEAACRVSHIFIRSPLGVQGKADAPVDQAALEKVKAVGAELAKGISFEECASRFSEDSSRNKKGDAGYIIFDMMSAPYSQAAFSLKEGDYTKEPVRTNEGYYFVNVTDKKNLNYNKVGDVVKDANAASRIKAGIYSRAVKLYVEKLSAESDVLFSEDAAKGGAGNAVVYKIGDRVLTADGLKEKYSFLLSSYNAASSVNLSADKKVKYAKDLYDMDLLCRDARRAGFESSEKYLKNLGFVRDMVLSREYLKKISAFTGAIPESLLRA